MRITAHRMLELAGQAAGKAQSEVADLAAQVSSGRRVDNPSDDPVAWAHARRLELRKTFSEGRGSGLELGRDQLSETDRALNTIADILAEARQSAIQAANGYLSAEDRAALQESMKGLFEVARSAANSRLSSGEFLLAGSLSTAEPFDATGAYVGDARTRSLETAETGTGVVSVPGTVLTAANGVDVLPSIQRFVTALGANDLVGIQKAIDEFNTGHRQVNLARSHVGSMMVVFDDADLVRGQLEDTLAARVASLTEIDITTAASELAQRARALEAAQTVNGRLAELLRPAR